MKRIIIKALFIGLVVIGASFPCYADKLVIEGSTTVLPIAQRAAEVFMEQHSGADISVRGGGSGVGIASLIDGNCDIADASRSIKEKELDKAVANGKSVKAHVVAMDGIAVVVHPSNKVGALTKKQVKDIYTGKINDWSELGGDGGKIVAVSRDTSSGTFEAFGELALDKAKVRPDAVMQASNQAVASAVSKTPGAIGYIGLGFLGSAVKPVEIDGVMPSIETVLNNKYPIGRPLFMYTNGTPAGIVKEFIDFVKSEEGQKIVSETGYVSLK
jgi:phosphate transport system substrate-binding protein